MALGLISMAAIRILAAFMAVGAAGALRLRPVRMQLPQAQKRQETLVAGGDPANILHGKLQRASQLPTTRLNKTPIAAVNDRGALSSLLWSSFAMSNVPSSAWLEPARLPNSFMLRDGLLFYDMTTDDPKSGLGGFKMPKML